MLGMPQLIDAPSAGKGPIWGRNAGNYRQEIGSCWSGLRSCLHTTSDTLGHFSFNSHWITATRAYLGSFRYREGATMSFRVLLTYTLNLFFGLIYPTAKSIEAVESAEGGHDDAQWLMYWIIYTLLLVTETLLWPALKWLPLYGEAKAMLLAWLVLPQFKGATWVYETIIGPGTARLRTELQKVPALERMWNQEDAAPLKALSSEEEARSVDERKTRVTLTTQEARDALISKLHDIEGIADAKVRQKAWKAFDKDVAKVAKVGTSKYA